MIRLYAQSNIKYFFRFSNMSLNQFFTAINTTICNRDCKSHVSLYPCLSFLIYFLSIFNGILRVFATALKNGTSWNRNVLSAMTCLGLSNFYEKGKENFFSYNFMNARKSFFCWKQVLVYLLKQKQKLALSHALFRPYVL